MPAIDQLLLDPTPAALVSAIRAAQKKANGRSKRCILRQKEPYWERFVRQAFRSAEGWKRWMGGTSRAVRLDLAWWSDRLGRRHWRILAGEKWYGEAPPQDEFPALARVYPGIMLGLRRGGVRGGIPFLPESETWVVVCPGCGVSGSPDALGWTGPCCGPCHDRTEESGQSQVHPAVLPIEGRKEVTSLRFTTAGELLAAAGNVILRWRLPDARPEVLIRLPDYWPRLKALGPGGQFVRACERPRGLHWHEPGQPVQFVNLPGCSVAHCDFSPDGLRLLAVGRLTFDCAYLVSASAGTPESAAARRLSQASALDLRLFDTDGRRLVGANADLGPVFLDPQTGAEERLPAPSLVRPVGLEFGWRPPTRHLAISQEWLAIACSIADPPLHALHRPTGQWQTLPVIDQYPQALAIDPTGRVLLGVIDSGIDLWELGSSKPPVRVRPARPWLSGRMTALGFSRDGATLAAGTHNGTLHLWPWAGVLQAIQSGSPSG